MMQNGAPGRRKRSEVNGIQPLRGGSGTAELLHQEMGSGRRGCRDYLKDFVHLVIIQPVYIALVLILSLGLYHLLPRYLNVIVSLFIIPPLLFWPLSRLLLRIGSVSMYVIIVTGVTSFTMWVPMTGILYSSSICESIMLVLNAKTIEVDASAPGPGRGAGFYIIRNFVILKDSYGFIAKRISAKHLEPHIETYYAVPVISPDRYKSGMVSIWIYEEVDSPGMATGPLQNNLSYMTGELRGVPVYDPYEKAYAIKAMNNSVDKYNLKPAEYPLFIKLRESREVVLAEGVKSIKIAGFVIALIWILFPAFFILIKGCSSSYGRS